MKFAAALIALGAQAVKLYQEEDGSNQEQDWETRSARVMSVIDWNGDELVDEGELKDLIFIAETFGYIDGDEADELGEFAEGVIDYFGGPFSAEELHDEVNYILEAAEGIEVMEGLMEGAEQMIIDSAKAYTFDLVDDNGDDAIDGDEVDAMVEDLELDDEEAAEVYEAFVAADVDEDDQVTYDEWDAAIEWAMEEDPELRWEILEEAADAINEWDVDCGEDGCEDERAAFRAEFEEDEE